MSSSESSSRWYVRPAVTLTLAAAAAATVWYLKTRGGSTCATKRCGGGGRGSGSARPTVSDDEALYVGVDGGGTSTTIIILNSSSTVIAQASAPTTNHNSMGSEKCQQALRHGLLTALRSVYPQDHEQQLITRLNHVRSIVCAMSGCNRPADVDLIRSWIDHIFPYPPQHVHIYNDSVGALASGTMGVLHGIVLIAGTGMIAYGRRDSPTPREHVAAGNGALIDAGSGYAIGMDILRACFSAHDGMGPTTRLMDATLKHLKLSTVPDLLGWLYPDLSWSRPASLAPLAFQLAAGSPAERDPVAYDILVRNANFLIRSVETVAKKLEFGNEEVTVVLAGGLLQDPTLHYLVTTGVRQFLPNAVLTYPRVDPAHGAALLAKNVALIEDVTTFTS